MELLKRTFPATCGIFRRPLLFYPISYTSPRLFSNSSNPFLSKLLLTPSSQIKFTLDSDSSSLKTSQSTVDSIVTALRSSSPDKACLVLEWRLDSMLKDNEIDHLHYSNLISLCAKIQNVSLAFRIFTSMENLGIKSTPSVFNSLIHVCLSSPSSVIIAVSLFELMENSQEYKPTSQTYDTFILGFSNFRYVPKIQAWFSAKKAAGFSWNSQNYKSIICGCVRTKDFDGVDRYYDELMLMGVNPSVVILEYMVESLCKCRNIDGVTEYLKFLVDCRFEFSGNMIEKVVKLYYELGKTNKLEELLESLTELDLKGEFMVHFHCEMIRLYVKLDSLNDVEYSLGRMMSRGMYFRSADDVEKVIASYFRKQAYDRLDLFLHHVKGHQKLSRSTYDLLVAGYKRVRLTEKLDLVIRDMELTGLL